MKRTTFLKSSLAALLLLVVSLLLTGCGGRDETNGYYMLEVNPATEAPQEKQQQTSMLFGMDRLAINEDHTYRFGVISGNWKRSGATITLEPTVQPKEPPYAQTTMAGAIGALLTPADFTVSADGKKLTAVETSKGPLVFTKMESSSL